jgi:hypothetical protein
MQSLRILPQTLTIHQIAPGQPLPVLEKATFASLVVAADEVTWVSEEAHCAVAHKSDAGWRAIKIEAVMDFSVVGVMAAFSTALAQAGIGLFAISTFNTDYILVKHDDIRRAQAALEKAGYRFL